MPQAQIIGTSLLSLVLPNVIGSYTHYRLGNVRLRLVPMLMVGSAIGATCGGFIAARVPDEYLRWLFSSFLALNGARSLIKLTANR